MCKTDNPLQSCSDLHDESGCQPFNNPSEIWRTADLISSDLAMLQEPIAEMITQCDGLLQALADAKNRLAELEKSMDFDADPARIFQDWSDVVSRPIVRACNQIAQLNYLG